MRNKTLSIILLLTAFLVSTLLSSQTRVSIKAPDSLAFVVYVNDQKVNNIPCLSITFDQSEFGKINFKTEFPGHEKSNFTQSLSLKKNSSTFYEIEKYKGSMKLALKSESALEVSITSAANTASIGSQEITSDIPAIASDSTSGSVAGTGCSPEVSAELYQEMIQAVKENFFESRKLELMKNFISQNCVRVEQLRFMMSNLSMEDNKIILLKASNGRISDVNNLKKVEEDFFLQKNKAWVVEILNQQYPTR